LKFDILVYTVGTISMWQIWLQYFQLGLSSKYATLLYFPAISFLSCLANWLYSYIFWAQPPYYWLYHWWLKWRCVTMSKWCLKSNLTASMLDFGFPAMFSWSQRVEPLWNDFTKLKQQHYF